MIERLDKNTDVGKGAPIEQDGFHSLAPAGNSYQAVSHPETENQLSGRGLDAGRHSDLLDGMWWSTDRQTDGAKVVQNSVQ